MLHDPEMECTCDGDNCSESVFLPMTWSVGGYDLTDANAKRILKDDHGWETEDDFHYCESCIERNRYHG